MPLSTGILVGIVAMSFWGVADLFAVKALRKTNPSSTFFWSRSCILILLLFLIPFFRFPKLTPLSILLSLAVGILTFVAFSFYYKGLSTGKLSVMSPLISSWAAVTAVISVLFLGERLSATGWMGVISAVAGAVLVSGGAEGINPKNLVKYPEAKYGIIAALSWGLAFSIADILTPLLGWFYQDLITSVATVLVGGLFLFFSGKRETISPKKFIFPMAIVGILEGFAYLFYSFGISGEYSAIVAPVGASAPLVTVFLGVFFLKEKPSKVQLFGALLVVLGVVFLAL